MNEPVAVCPCGAGMSDGDLAGLAGRCSAEAEGLEAPDERGVGRLRALQKPEAETLVLAVWNGAPVGLCAVELPTEAGPAILRFLGVIPERRRRGVGRRLEAHAEALARRHGCPALRTGTSMTSRNAAGVRFLEDSGWKPASAAGIRMWRNLEDLPPVELAAGYSIRTYRPGDEAEFVRIKNAAFSTEPGSGQAWTVADFRKEYLDAPCFRPERVFFAVYDGQPVGTTTAWTAEHEGREVGLIHWVAVQPDHRRKGLGQALNVQALHKLKALGYREAILNTSERLASAVRLYHRLGFHDYARRAPYEKRLES